MRFNVSFFGAEIDALYAPDGILRKQPRRRQNVAKVPNLIWSPIVIIGRNLIAPGRAPPGCLCP
jgi:hypothetical protein